MGLRRREPSRIIQEAQGKQAFLTTTWPGFAHREFQTLVAIGREARLSHRAQGITCKKSTICMRHGYINPFSASSHLPQARQSVPEPPCESASHRPSLRSDSHRARSGMTPWCVYYTQPPKPTDPNIRLLQTRWYHEYPEYGSLPLTPTTQASPESFTS